MRDKGQMAVKKPIETQFDTGTAGPSLEGRVDALAFAARGAEPQMPQPPWIHRIRIECLKIAMERVTATKPPRSIIEEAREYEAYVLEAPETEEPETE